MSTYEIDVNHPSFWWVWLSNLCYDNELTTPSKVVQSVTSVTEKTYIEADPQHGKILIKITSRYTLMMVCDKRVMIIIYQFTQKVFANLSNHDSRLVITL